MYSRFTELLRQSQLQKNALQTATLRLLLSELKYAEIQKGETLDNAEIVAVIQREAKKRRESIAAFTQGGRAEQAQKEREEEVFLNTLLPRQLSDEELTKVVFDTITKLGAAKISDLGKVIGSVMSQVSGQADGSRVSTLARELLLNSSKIVEKSK